MPGIAKSLDTGKTIWNERGELNETSPSPHFDIQHNSDCDEWKELISKVLTNLSEPTRYLMQDIDLELLEFVFDEDLVRMAQEKRINVPYGVAFFLQELLYEFASQ